MGVYLGKLFLEGFDASVPGLDGFLQFNSGIANLLDVLLELLILCLQPRLELDYFIFLRINLDVEVDSGQLISLNCLLGLLQLIGNSLAFVFSLFFVGCKENLG